MPTEIPRVYIEIEYHEAAQEYLRNLPPEHFMEATPQSAQRRITLASLALVEAKRADFHLFNELLVQYPLRRPDRIGQVVPDNMVVIHPDPLDADGSYDVPLQPARPFWVLEYVSKGSKRKDYHDNRKKYEVELKVPYFLLFEPSKEKVTLFRHNKRRYHAVAAAANGRFPIKELEIEIGLVNGWVRFWYQGELLPLPAELQDALEETRRELTEAKRLAATATRRADTAARRADAETRRADTETLRADTETLRADAETRRADTETQARLAAERELAELRARLSMPKQQRS